MGTLGRLENTQQWLQAGFAAACGEDATAACTPHFKWYATSIEGLLAVPQAPASSASSERCWPHLGTLRSA